MATAIDAASRSDNPAAMDVMAMLKAVAAGEAEAGRRLPEWAAMTGDAKLAETLRFIAARETSHAEVFSRRITELGETVDLGVVPPEAAYIAMLSDPAVPDREKALCILGGAEFFAEVERNIEAGAYDPLTAKLLSWYVAEERDSQDRMRRTGAAD